MLEVLNWVKAYAVHEIAKAERTIFDTNSLACNVTSAQGTRSTLVDFLKEFTETAIHGSQNVNFVLNETQKLLQGIQSIDPVALARTQFFNAPNSSPAVTSSPAAPATESTADITTVAADAIADAPSSVV